MYVSFVLPEAGGPLGRTKDEDEDVEVVVGHMRRCICYVDCAVMRDVFEPFPVSGPRGEGSDEAELLSPRQIAEALRNGACPEDASFDRYLPVELRSVSGRYWTPLAVARRAAEWLEELGAETALDVGSGAGKLCVAAALVGSCRFIGLEHRPRLVAASRALARRFEVEDRVTFVEGAFGAVSTPKADAYYLYNPFGENLYGSSDCLDQDVELGNPRYRRDIAAAEALLTNAPVGTILLTYNGFGGRIPSNYVDRKFDVDLPCILRAFEKTSAEERLATRVLESHEELEDEDFDDDD